MSSCDEPKTFDHYLSFLSVIDNAKGRGRNSGRGEPARPNNISSKGRGSFLLANDRVIEMLTLILLIKIKT